MIFSVETADWLFSLEGSAKPAIWKSRSGSQQPTLEVVTSGGDAITSLSWPGTEYACDGSRRYKGDGPPLFEETAYKLTVLSKAGRAPKLVHLDPALVSGVGLVAGHADVLTGTINFRSQVGRSEFKLVDGVADLAVTIEIRPTKLDYETDYDDLLDGVSGLARQLVLEFLRATTRGANVQQTTRNADVEWLLLLRNEVEALDRALAYIVEHPHRQLVRQADMVHADKIRRPSASTRRAIARGQGEGAWTSSVVAPHHRERLPSSLPFETVDSPENRWLRHQVTLTTRTLTRLRSEQEDRLERQRARGSSGLRGTAIVDEIRSMENRLSPYLSVSPLAEAVGSYGGEINSLVLQGAPGYREASQSLLRLRMAMIVTGSAVATPLRDLSDLYEIWCFIAVLQLVSEELGVPIDAHDLVELNETGMKLKLTAGSVGTVKIESPKATIAVSYNREYRMLSGTQRPDIVIEIRRADLPPVVLILDAKYRLDTSDEYTRTYGCPGPPPDAVGQLHRYRDSILVRKPGQGRGRPVVRAVALFPLGEADSNSWPGHAFCRSIDEVGIGALPFLPTNLDWVRAWISHALCAPAMVLAWPGPDFIAWTATRGDYFFTDSANTPTTTLYSRLPGSTEATDH